MRRPIALIYLLIFVDEVALLCLVPLVPVYTERFGLSKLQGGALLSAASLAIVVASIPAGVLADRLGARRVTIVAGLLVAAGNLLQALAGSFDALLLARLVFGFGSAAIWAAGISWLSDSASEQRRTSAIGAVVATAGLGGFVGPVLVGTLAQQVSVRAALIGVAAAAAVVTVAMAVSHPGGRRHHEHTPLREVLRAARGERLIAGGIAIMLLGGFADGVVNLLGSLELTARGLSTAANGGVFSASAGIFIVVSALVARIGGRAMSLRAAGVASILQAGVLVPVVLTLAVVPVATMILSRAALAAWPYTIGLPLAALGARRRGIGTATVNGLFGIAWGAANFVGGPAAGWVAGWAGDRIAYVGLAAISLTTGLWLVRPRSDGAHSEPEPAAAVP